MWRLAELAGIAGVETGAKMTKPASESPLESLVVSERSNESVAQGNKNPVQGDSAQSSPITEEQLRETEAANEKHRIDWRHPNQKDRIRDLCRSLRAAWAQVAEWESHRRGFIELFTTAEARVEDLEAENATLRQQLATQAESIIEFQENERKLQAQLVNAVIPYEALLMDVESRKWIAPGIWKEIESTVIAIRAVVKENL